MPLPLTGFGHLPPRELFFNNSLLLIACYTWSLYLVDMAIIEEGHPALSGSAAESWADLISNSKIILFELDKAILALTREGIKSFSLNTGQTAHNVTPLDLPVLIQRRKDLIEQIQELEEAEAYTEPPALTQVVPSW